QGTVGPRPVRRVPQLPGAVGPPGPTTQPGAGLDAHPRRGSGTRAGVRGDLQGHRPLLARIRAGRGPGRPGEPVPAVALPPHAYRHADHRLQAGDRRVLRRRVPAAGPGAELLPGAVRGTDTAVTGVQPM